MAKQGYPSSGGRFGAHPGVGGYPVVGSRYGAHPDSSSPAPPTPPTETFGTIAVANSQTLAGNFRSDYGYVLGPDGGVASIQDLSGAGLDSTEVVAAQQPLWIADDGGTPSISFDGVDDRLTNAWAHAAITTATASTHIWMLLLAAQDSWTANDTLVSDGGLTVDQNTTAGGVRLFGGTANSNQNNNWTGFKLILVNFTGSASNYVRIGNSLAQGPGNVGLGAATTSLVIGAAPGSVRYCHMRLKEFAWGFGDFSPTAETAIRTYAAARYGASVIV